MDTGIYGIYIWGMADLRTFNCPEGVWNPAAERAKREGHTLTRVIVDFLARYGNPSEVVTALAKEVSWEVNKLMAEIMANPATAEALKGTARAEIESVPADIETAEPVSKPEPVSACPHPKARVLKGFCSACGTGGH